MYLIVLRVPRQVPKFGFVLCSAGEIFKNKVPGLHISSSESNFLEVGLRIFNV